ncbi:MAG: leucine-rich repeat domain-containing protein [Bacteroidia bacterium]|nr:leucine-rich repeat domain-containing protein [Bacteroidia bacterium]
MHFGELHPVDFEAIKAFNLTNEHGLTRTTEKGLWNFARGFSANGEGRVTRLYISNGHKLRLESLKDLTEMEYVWINGATMPELGIFSGMLKLRELGIVSSRVKDLSGLEKLTQLEILKLGGNHGISSLESIQGLKKLNTLDLFSNQVVDASPLAALPLLEHLDISCNGRLDIQSLTGLTQLKSLNLRMCGVEDISPLKSLVNLESLDLDHNRIRDPGPLESMTKLSYLTADGNLVEDLLPLLQLTCLKKCSLMGNKIKNIPLGFNHPGMKISFSGLLEEDPHDLAPQWDFREGLLLDGNPVAGDQ